MPEPDVYDPLYPVMSEDLAALDEVVDRICSAGLLLRGFLSGAAMTGTTATVEQAVGELDTALADLRLAVARGVVRRRRSRRFPS